MRVSSGVTSSRLRAFRGLATQLVTEYDGVLAPADVVRAVAAAAEGVAFLHADTPAELVEEVARGDLAALARVVADPAAPARAALVPPPHPRRGQPGAPEPKTCVVSAAGELDLGAAPTLAADIKAALATGARDLVIDLGAVTFMDVSGVNALLDARTRVRRSGGSLRLLAPSAPVLRVLRAAGVDRLFVRAHR